MVPIYDTDIAESRWQQAEWRQFELWEKIEQRARRRLRLICLGAMGVFLLISSVPVLQSGFPKWVSLHELRKIGQLWSASKTKAIQEKSAYTWVFVNQSAEYTAQQGAKPEKANGEEFDSLDSSSGYAQIYELKVESCRSIPNGKGNGSRLIYTARPGYFWMDPARAKLIQSSSQQINQEGLSLRTNPATICFDSVEGLFFDGHPISEIAARSGSEGNSQDFISLGLVAGQNLPSVSLLNLKGSSAEISFE